MSRDQRRPRMPKPRIPVAPPGIRHKSKKDYERVKKVEVPHPDDDYGHDRHCDCSWCVDEDHGEKDDLMFLLNRLGIVSASTYRLVSYG